MRPRHLKRAAENALRRWLIRSLIAGIAIAYPLAVDFKGFWPGGTAVALAGRVVIIGDPQQNDINIQWLALDPGHGSYAAALTNLASAAYTGYEVADGGNGYTGLKIVGPVYASDAQLSAWGLATIDGSLVIDRLNYSKAVNPNYTTGTRTLRTNAWGDQYYLYGQFLRAPQRIPTTGYDRLLAHWKGQGSDTVCYVATTATGDGSGDSYANKKAFADLVDYLDGRYATTDPTNYTIFVFCGLLSRRADEGSATVKSVTTSIGFRLAAGTANAPILLLAHPVDGGSLTGGTRIGVNGSAGIYTEGAWTFDQSGTWYCDYSSNRFSSFSQDIADRFVMSDEGGTMRALKRVADAATCYSTSDSYYATSTRAYVHLSGGGSPETNTYFGWRAAQGGASLYRSGNSYREAYGITFYQGAINAGIPGLTPKEISYSWYACEFAYHCDCGSWGGGLVDADTGQHLDADLGPIVFSQITSRNWVGCTFRYVADGPYDVVYHCKVPQNTTIRDCYFIGTGKNLTATYGVRLDQGDNHSIATLGGYDGATITNNRFYDCGYQLIVMYVPDTGHVISHTKVLTDGAISNGTFASDTVWTKGGTATISGGTGNLVAVNDYLEQSVTVGAGYLTITGSAATKSGDVITLDGSPDLSALITTSGDTQSQIRLNSFPNTSGGTTYPITAFDNVAKTVTVDNTFGSPTGSGTTAWTIGRKHVFKFTLSPAIKSDLQPSSINVKIGSTSGGTDFYSGTVSANFSTGVCAVAFAPTTTTIYIRVTGTVAGQTIDNASLLTTLGNENGYTEGYAPSAANFYNGRANYIMVPAQDIDISYNLITDLFDNQGSGSCQVFSLNGDATYGYGGQVSNLKIRYNRVENTEIAVGLTDATSDGAVFRNKWQLPSPYDYTQIEFSYNTVRNVRCAVTPVNSFYDENGDIVLGTYWFHHNDVHTRYHYVETQTGANKKVVLDYNTYRIDSGTEGWTEFLTTTTDLATWRTMADAGDTYDTNSTHVALGA